MAPHRALIGMLLAAGLGACAVQLNEEVPGVDPGSGGSGATGATIGKGGTTSTGGKGGGTSTAGTAGSGNGGSPDKGGSSAGGSSAGTTNEAGSDSGGSSGSTSGGSSGSGNGGSSGSGSGGSGNPTSCTGLPEWAPGAAPPDPPMDAGDELTFNQKKWTFAGSSALWNFEGDCPPETTPERTRMGWCETSANQFTLVGACE